MVRLNREQVCVRLMSRRLSSKDLQMLTALSPIAVKNAICGYPVTQECAKRVAEVLQCELEDIVKMEGDADA